MATFRYDPAVIERFPDIHAGVVFASGLSTGPSAAALTTSYQAVQTEVRARIEGLAIAEHPSIHTWRRTLSAFGVKPTQHRVAAEALMRRLSKVGDIPSINTLVDIGNLVSIRYAMPVAAMDLAASPGGFTVTFAEGTEPFTDLGADEPDHSGRRPPAARIRPATGVRGGRSLVRRRRHGQGRRRIERLPHLGLARAAA